jgi:uridine kinase
MHEKFVEPSKQYADILIPGGGHNLQAVRLLLALLQTLPEK